ncbi:hypothetical protein TNCV_451901 [Trichonephila clavipes]|nr:hypothetical protein TNCV_451901 [Trichonephila clavipes]
MTTLAGSHHSILTDWMDGIDTPGILNIRTAKSLLVSDLETEETAWKLAKFGNDSFFPNIAYANAKT